MRKKPLIVEIIAIIVCVFPAIVFGRVFAYMQVRNLEMPLQSWIQIVALALVSYVIGYGVWKVRLWGYYGILLMSTTTIVVVVWNWLQSNVPLIQLSNWIYFDVTCAALALFLIVQKAVRQPYFDPRVRWWETAERYVGDIAGVFRINETKIESPILDLSATGCFANFESTIEVGTAIDVEINFNSIRFTAPAVLVRRSLSPIGLGLKFTSVSAESKESMKKILEQLTKKR